MTAESLAPLREEREKIQAWKIESVPRPACGEPFPVENAMNVHHEQEKIVLLSVWRGLTRFTVPAPPTVPPAARTQAEENP